MGFRYKAEGRLAFLYPLSPESLDYRHVRNPGKGPKAMDSNYRLETMFFCKLAVSPRVFIFGFCSVWERESGN